MATDTFLQALQRITAGDFSLGDLIGAASALKQDGQAATAEQLYRIWIGFNPGNPQLYAAYFNLSTLLGAPDQIDASVGALQKAIESKADFWPALVNLGSALERKGDASGAVAQWKIIADKLDQVTGVNVGLKLTAMKQIGRVLIDHQQVGAAEGYLQECLLINPRQRDVLEQYVGLRLQQCQWPVLTPWDGASRETLMEGVSPLTMAAYTDDPLLQLAAAARYSEAMVSEAPPPSAAHDRRGAEIDLAGRRLRVGYVSSDLRDHAVGYLMAEVFELHDAQKVETFAYYCGPPPSGALYERFRASAEHWTDLTSLNDDEAAVSIAADAIDILVDVNGHTRFGRVGIFARRPAPIIVNWLGFPGTLGTPFHSYLVADERIVPPGHELYYAEKVLRLPCYQPNDRKRQVAETPSRAVAGLPEAGFVFCCFNGAQKITRFTFDRWTEILRRTPDSVLWLLEGDAATAERLREQAEARGVDRGRLIFAPKLANAHHLARYPLADLFLDTFPYGAHTTASDALWMGVPVLTLEGRGFASRVCASLAAAAGLEGLTVTTPADYVERAVALAAADGGAAIAALKSQLAATRDSCVLFDTPLLMSSLEGLYAQMVGDYRRGELPRPDLANLEPYFRVGLEHDPDTSEIGEAGDYHGLYLERLGRRHRMRPIGPDARLWTAEAIAAAEPAPVKAAVRLVAKAS